MTEAPAAASTGPTGTASTPPAKKSTSSRGGHKKLHVLVHRAGGKASTTLDDAVIYGDELKALRDAVHREGDWSYVTVEAGQSIAEALKAQT